MDSDNSISKFVSILKPLIEDLEDEKNELANQKDELESVSRFLAYTKDNVEMVGVYADQELIINNLEKVGCSKEQYKASCYLLQSENDSVKNLPQYEEANDLINNIVEMFKLYKAELIVQIEDLNNICERKTIEKKYYDILSDINPHVEDISEFLGIINDYDLTKDEIINILETLINNNIKYYESGNK